eukprot:5738405-Pyramimonas_sp.AAC.1
MESVANDAAEKKNDNFVRHVATHAVNKEKHTSPLTSPRGVNWLANADTGEKPFLVFLGL